MKGKKSLRAELKSAAHKAGGSNKTKAERRAAIGRLCDFLARANIQVRRVQDLRGTHVEKYAADMLARGLAARTTQSEMSAIRVTMRGAGFDTEADRIDNRRIGIAGASRRGTHKAMPDDRYIALRAELARRDPGVAACAALQRTLGLRAKESIMSPVSLKTWAAALDRGAPLHVIGGTKGSRLRDVHPPAPLEARAAVAEAIRVCAAPDSGGTLFQGRGLKAAMARYHRVMYSARARGVFSGHSLRYAFAKERYQRYRQDGLSKREAKIATITDLGHGDGRGRLLDEVYMQAEQSVPGS